jgi:hypothetical protein
MKSILKFKRAFLWAASDKVSSRKCKVKWELVPHPKNMSGLGVLDLQIFVRALRLP